MRCRPRPPVSRPWCSEPAAPLGRSVWALVREGAEVEVWNRTELRAEHLCDELGGRPVVATRTRTPTS